ncbi:MAG: FAD-dependent oxidoreductase [Caldilineaceae bacterium]|nr:FAD-dependent oxidoreductase [Caldilineaceae bacterium]
MSTHSYQYVIIGGGMAAGAAAQGIRELDADGSIALIAAEQAPPYKRPPLSKGLWKGEPVADIWLDTAKQGVEMYLGRRAQRLDVQNQRVVDEQGDEYRFDKLLLATGSTPKRLPLDGPGPHGEERVLYYRTFADYERLRQLAGGGSHFAVVGGGFIGSEIAAALTMNGKQVSLILRGERIGGHLYPQDLGDYLNDYYREKGVDLLTKTTVAGLRARGEQISVRLQGAGGAAANELAVDGVIVGIGVEPNVELAAAAGLEVTDGIVVDELLRAGHPAVYAAGDAANFYDVALGKRRRMEHEDNANKMGRAAGRNMAGAAERYGHSPFFYSDLFELGYEAVGETRASLETVSDWKEPYREGVVYYLREGWVRGVLLWNVWGQVEAARRLLREPGPFQPQDLMGRLPG